MKTKIKDLGQSKIEIEIEVEIEEFEKFRDKALSQAAEHLEVHGFRKGSAPLNVAKQKIGEEQILMDAANLAIQKNYLQAIKDNNFEPASQPEIQVLKLAPGNPFCFKAIFFVLPEIQLPDYKKIAAKIKKEKPVVEEDDIKQALEWVQKSRASFSEIDRPAKKQDFIEIEFSSAEIQDNKQQKDAFILGQGHLIKDFEESLIGMKAGDEKEFPVEFSKDYFKKDLAGKKIDFKVKMQSVKQVELPELSDDFVKSLGKFQNLADFEKSIRQGLEEEKQAAVDMNWRETVLTKIADLAKIEVPDFLLEAEKQRRLHELKHKVAEDLKVDFQDYLKDISKTEQELLVLMEDDCKKGIKKFLALKQIAEIEKIIVSEQEIEQETNKILARYPDIEQAKKNIDPQRLRSYTEERIRNQKIFTKLESFLEK